jgi:hypothetical protein
MLNEARPITEVVDIILCYKGHSECAIFTVTGIRQEEVILGLPWLREHNPSGQEDRGGENEPMSSLVHYLLR